MTETELDDRQLVHAPDSRKFPIIEDYRELYNLDERQQRAVEMLVEGCSLSRVVEVLRIDAKTLYNWRQNPQFRHCVARRVEEIWGESQERLRTLAGAAIESLARELAHGTGYSSLRAAILVLKLSGMEKALAESKRGSEQP